MNAESVLDWMACHVCAAGIPLFLFGAGLMVGAAVTRSKGSSKQQGDGFLAAPV